jgi:hypothetical protein
LYQGETGNSDKKKSSSKSRGRVGRVFVEGRSVIVNTGEDLVLDSAQSKFLHFYSYTTYTAHLVSGKEIKTPLVHRDAVVYVMKESFGGEYWFREVRDAGSLEMVMNKFFPDGMSRDDPRLSHIPHKFYHALERMYNWESQSG